MRVSFRDDSPKLLLFDIREETDSSICFCPHSHKARRIVSSSTVAYRFAEDEREERTVTIRGRGSLRVTREPVIDVGWLDLVDGAVAEVWKDLLQP